MFQPFIKILDLQTCSSCLLIFATDLRSAFCGFHEAGDGAHEVVLGENLETVVAHFDEDRGILVTQNVRDALDRSGSRNLWKRLAHHFAHYQLAQILALQRQIQNLILINPELF